MAHGPWPVGLGLGLDLDPLGPTGPGTGTTWGYSTRARARARALKQIRNQPAPSAQIAAIRSGLGLVLAFFFFSGLLFSVFVFRMYAVWALRRACV
jgi:hypothetical protein